MRLTTRCLTDGTREIKITFKLFTTIRIEETMEKSPQMMMSTRCGESNIINAKMGMTVECVGMGTITEHLASPRWSFLILMEVTP